MFIIPILQMYRVVMHQKHFQMRVLANHFIVHVYHNGSAWHNDHAPHHKEIEKLVIESLRKNGIDGSPYG